MSRISQDLAQRIAIKLTEKSRVAADRLHMEFRELVTQLYEDAVPDAVKKCFKTNSEWFYTTSSINLDGHGFRWEYVAGTKAVICNKNSDAVLKMTSAIADKLTASKRKWEKAKEEYNSLRDESKQAILALKTFNNIRRELPQAAPMLPPPISNALVCNFDTLKKKLEKQPDIKETKTVAQ